MPLDRPISEGEWLELMERPYTPPCHGQHTGCAACMTFYLQHHANTCTYGKGKAA